MVKYFVDNYNPLEIPDMRGNELDGHQVVAGIEAAMRVVLDASGALELSAPSARYWQAHSAWRFELAVRQHKKRIELLNRVLHDLEYMAEKVMEQVEGKYVV